MRSALLKSRLQFRPKLWASYFSAFLVLSVGIMAVIQNREARAAVERANLFRLTIHQLLETEILLLNAETGQRGYLLTGDTRYRRPYDIAAPKIEQQLHSLSRLVSTDPVLFRGVQELGTLARLKLEELGDTIRVRDMGGDALARVKKDTGQLLMERIRARVEALAQRARSARDAQEKRAAALQSFAPWFVGLGNAFAYMLAVAITFWIGTAFRENQSAREHVERDGLQLAQNAQRLELQDRALALRLAEERRLSASLERANAALQKSNSDLEFFAYMASHDLRAPLRGIANVSEWIEQDLGDTAPPATRRQMEILRGRVYRLEALIDAIASYARAGRGPRVAESLDLEELMQEVVEGLAKPPSIEVSWEKPLPKLRTMRQPLQQILTNLLSNAIKHGSRDGGRITLSVTDTGPSWSFAISDDGPGIAAEYHHKIFGLFQRLVARDRVEGAGIGLAIVKKLVDQYGGQIAVTSSPGKGATFLVTWPKETADDGLGVAHG